MKKVFAFLLPASPLVPHISSGWCSFALMAKPGPGSQPVRIHE
ncbi:hypothetical protein [Erwinia typographi]|nr:hypothetical protein [Erwinia typographi]